MMSYFQDGGHDSISCRKVLPSGALSHYVLTFMKCLPGVYAAVL